MEKYYLAQTTGIMPREHPIKYRSHQNHENCAKCAYVVQLAEMPSLKGCRFIVHEKYIFIDAGWWNYSVGYSVVQPIDFLPWHTIPNNIIMINKYLQSIGCTLLGRGSIWWIIDPIVIYVYDLYSVSRDDLDYICASIERIMNTRKIISAGLPQPIAEDMIDHI
jgi:hypothetical protein